MAFFDETKQVSTDVNGNLQWVDPIYFLLGYDRGSSDLQSFFSSYLTEQGQLNDIIKEKYMKLQKPTTNQVMNIPPKMGGMAYPGHPFVGKHPLRQPQLLEGRPMGMIGQSQEPIPPPTLRGFSFRKK